MSLGDKIKELREDKRISIRGLGRLTDVSGMHISNIEKNKMNASPELVTRIAQALDEKMDYEGNVAQDQYIAPGQCKKRREKANQQDGRSRRFRLFADNGNSTKEQAVGCQRKLDTWIVQ